MMYTHKYTRSKLSTNRLDSYNSLLGAPLYSHSAKTPPIVEEYWTNGHVTEYYWTATTTTNPETDHTSTPFTTNSPRGTMTALPQQKESAHRHLVRPRAPSNATRGNNVSRTLIAGSCAGIVSTVLIYPMDVLRTKLQASHVGARPWQVLTETLQHGGLRALYTGITLPLMAQIVYKGTIFTINNASQNILLDFKRLEREKFGLPPVDATAVDALTFMDRFWCGVVGGAVNAAAFVTPVEFVRSQLIAQHSKLASRTAAATAAVAIASAARYRGSWDVIRHAVREQGVASLWRGTSWSVARDGIGCGFFFLTMAYAQQKLTAPEEEKPSFAATVVSGGLAGLAFWVSALPLDTVKTWVQSSDLARDKISVRATVHAIFQESGSRGVLQRLFRGWQFAYGRGIPSAAITITTYTVIFQYLQDANAM